ncbi:hypothetical protein [Pseudobacter ginsenosidimutans]|uniref:Uncharacterized protein n=1 Tax=Pseudobacter ginsenosidimutans TaxID=661488 RepID=A0A4Q7N4V9_9BACT|nr:hypothetical protein [Pseudobacter ginsenosidimutans]QEC44583.1 hypothetical protein FSB84_23965 [Pseudobacter ginsenosidimutans]RZS76062.1 hypothetical protein EV199_1939 [Pseudobacter ginsenosidimutans]
MKKYLIVAAIALLSVLVVYSSGKKIEPAEPHISNTYDGTVNATLTAGGKEFKVTGSCGTLEAGFGDKKVKKIAGNHKEVPTRAINITFLDNQLPTKTTKYTIVKARKIGEARDTDPSHVTIWIGEIINKYEAGKIVSTTNTSWYSSNNSGQITINVNGNKITASLDGIVLKPRTAADNPIPSKLDVLGNTGAFASDGKLSGTIDIAKK